MATERNIRRYAAFFHGWATAFGHHDKYVDEGRNLQWLFGEKQIGLILTPAVRSFLHPLFLGSREAAPPRVELGPGALRIAGATLRFGGEERRVLEAIMGLLADSGDLHLLQTYHLVYPTGTRILTLSRQSPLTLVYREIEPLTLHLL